MQTILFVGREKPDISDYLPDRCLIIDDGTLIDQLDLSEFQSVMIFDPTVHQFDPLRGMNGRTQRGFLKAEAFVELWEAVFGRADSTLTKDTGLEYVLDQLTKPHRQKLSRLIPEPNSRSTPGHQWAHGKLKRLLASPILRHVLDGDQGLSLTVRNEGKRYPKTVIVRLDRGVLGDLTCRVIGCLFMAEYTGQIVVPEFGFYAIPSHARLIRQRRLIAGINTFAEVPRLKAELEQIKYKIGHNCTPEDAEILSRYEGHRPGSHGYQNNIEKLIKPA